jgi:hypothetical protein
MTITSIGLRGSSITKVANAASRAQAVNADVAAGRLLVMIICVDNHESTDGDLGAVTGITDDAGGNTWTKAREYQYSGGGAQAGEVISIWFSRLTNGLTSGQNVTAAFSNSTSRDAAGIALWEFSVGGGIAVEASNAASRNGTPPSFDVTTANIECLRIRAIGRGSNNAPGLTPTTNWTEIIDAASSGGSSGTNNSLYAEFHISTGTGDASAPTNGVSFTSWTDVYVALKETATEYTRTAALAGAGALANTGIAITRVRTAAVAGAGAEAAAQGVIRDRTAALSATGTLAAIASNEKQRTAALSGAGATVIDGRRLCVVTAALTTTATLAGLPNPIRPAAAALSGAGTLVSPAIVNAVRSASLLGAASSLQIGGATRPRSAAFTATASVQAPRILNAGRTATLTGAGTLAAAGTRIGNASALSTGAGTVLAEGQKIDGAVRRAKVSWLAIFGSSTGGIKSAAASIVSHGTLAAAPEPIRPASAVLEGAGTLEAVRLATFDRSASLLGGASSLQVGGRPPSKAQQTLPPIKPF